ncbi:hypothetical protein BZG36_04495 [Bifiguratus adelaidae]|uniref:Uncharacterized protein n=1 Tax=Bifiguratus adelaidae TaxID=1938954 RepID=A0A261XYC7_9FUNG|nr:hypothetical protein BZG36_04495 [Bifiguratus adelaidae]
MNESTEDLAGHARGVSEQPVAQTEKPRRFYRKRKFWYICVPVNVILIIVIVLITLFVILPKIAQIIINGSSLTVNKVAISFQNPSSSSPSKRDTTDYNSTFWQTLDAKLSNTGPFSATIDFPNPINVQWEGNNLGSLTLDSVYVSGGGGSFTQTKQFNVTDQNTFANFTKYLVNAETFTWDLSTKINLIALGRSIDNLDMQKSITLNGINGFPGVKVLNFSAPNDSSDGGINIQIETLLSNPSSLQMQLGTIALAISFNGTYIGPVSAQGVTMMQGDNNVTLTGRIVPQNDTTAVNQLFSNYVSGKTSNTTATGVSAAPDGVHPVTWLSEGFQAVHLTAPLAAPQGLQLITGLNIGSMALAFTPQTAYSPQTSANNVVANYQIPFGFSLNFTNIQNDLGVAMPNGSIAVLSSGWVPATSNVTSHTVQFDLTPAAPLNVINGQQGAFNSFSAQLTLDSKVNFTAVGNASVQANTTIGHVTLTGIPFNTSTYLQGLQGLAAKPPTINSLDVVNGQSTHLDLALGLTVNNPSNLKISTGDVTLAFLYQTSNLGAVTMSNLTLDIGDNVLNATGTFDPNSSQDGMNLLTTFVAGQDNGVSVAGSENSTAVDSLKQGFSGVQLGTTLPGLKTKLIDSAALTILNNTIQTNVTNTLVTLSNPFTAGLKITTVKSTVTYKTLPVGSINADMSSNPIVVNGKTNGTSPPIPITLNLEPSAVALLLRELAVDAGLNTDPLDALLDLGGFSIGQKQIAADPSLFTGFNLVTFVEQAMSKLVINLNLNSNIEIGAYQTTLSYQQQNVPTKTDPTIANLIPVVGQPLVQSIVNQSKLSFSTIVLSSPTENSFNVQMKGTITNTGPLTAQIAFSQPLNVAWQGKTLGHVSMTPVTATPSSGATIDTTGDFTITDVGAMEAFTAYMLNNDAFTWDISAAGLEVTSLGYTFTGISFGKSVSLQGMGGLKGDVTIAGFNLPSNDPAGGITLTVSTVIKNPSSVGVNLEGLGFENYFENVDIGPAGATNVLLAPLATSNLTMQGRLIPQSGTGLQAVNNLFDNYLNGTESPLTIVGSYGSGPNGQVSWLSNAFKTLKIDNVMLPAGHNLNLIPSVTLEQLTLNFTTSTAYSPDSSSNKLVAGFQSPFGFPLDVQKISQVATVKVGGQDMATLNIPQVPAVTDQSAHTITLGYSNIPFAINSNAHSLFNSFTKALTLTNGGPFELAGTANAMASTAIGDLTLDGLKFDVQTTLAGFNDFGGSVTLSGVNIMSANAQETTIQLITTMNNPSLITISVGDVQFYVYYQNFEIGMVKITGLTLKPGQNQVPTTFLLAEPTTSQGQQIGVEFLSQYLSATGAQIPLEIKGSQDSTPIASLMDGFAGVDLHTTLTGLTDKLIISSHVTVTAVDFLTGTAQAQFTLYNPVGVSYSLGVLSANVTYGNLELTSFTHDFGYQFTVQPKSQGTSPTIDVPLKMSTALQLLPDLLAGKTTFPVFIQQQTTLLVGNGFKAGLVYSQNNVPLSIEVDFAGIPIIGGKINAASLPASFLQSVEQALGGDLSKIESIFTNIPGLTPATSVVSNVTSAVGSIAAKVTPAASAVTSAAGGIAGAITSALNIPGAATSQAPAALNTPAAKAGTTTTTSCQGLGCILG